MEALEGRILVSDGKTVDGPCSKKNIQERENLVLQESPGFMRLSFKHCLTLVERKAEAI